LRKVVYTCVTDSYDRVLAPLVVEPDVDYVVFSDRADQQVPAPWQLRTILRRERNARMTARWHKLHPHMLFSDHELSLYVDSNIALKAPVGALAEQMLAGAPIALFRHPERNCPYREAEVVARHRLDSDAIVEAQMTYYRAKGFPAGSGLHNSGVMFRRHADPVLAGFLEDWWRQLKIFSHRDQLSLDFMLRRHAIACAELPGLLTESPWFVVAPHKRFRVDIPDERELADGDELDWLRLALIAEARRRPKPVTVRALVLVLKWHLMRPLRAAKRLYLLVTWRPPVRAGAPGHPTSSPGA
jgi:Protein of unknown function (DUF616)